MTVIKTIDDYGVAPPAYNAECGACRNPLVRGTKQRHRFACLDCRLDYTSFTRPTYLYATDTACMAKQNDDVSELSPVGWCYLPAGHKRRHLFVS